MSTAQSIVVIGTSTGGLAALRVVLAQLPATFSLPILITMHVGERSILPERLAASTCLRVRHAVNGEQPEPGDVLVAPPGAHLLVVSGRVQLAYGAKENFVRPAIDPLFRSAAYAYRERAIGVLLTGQLDDGSVGLQAIKACGGIAIVQNPDDAEAAEMPLNALRYVDVDHCLGLQEIGQTLAAIAQNSPPRNRPPVPPGLDVECAMDANPLNATSEALDAIAPRSALVCPECQGVLWEMQGSPLRYRCHTGHAYTALSFANAQNNAIEEALWAAIRAVRDKELFFHRQQQRALEQANPRDAREYEMAAERARDNARLLIELATQKHD